MSLFKTFNIQYILVIYNNYNNNIIIKDLCDAKHTFSNTLAQFMMEGNLIEKIVNKWNNNGINIHAPSQKLLK